MAGHSKWANIKHRKAASGCQARQGLHQADSRNHHRGPSGWPAPARQSAVARAVAKALGSNMTRDTINRAIQRGAGGGDEQQLDEHHL
jgi:transcriptional/translational regulatory protein YebC/TACO1